MWRFFYWDPNRRQHTVWLNDAAGFKPAFEIARRYRLGRIALDGVSVGIDPALWRMVKDFIETGDAPAVPTSYRLTWRLMDDAGRVVQEAIQPLEDHIFRFQAPRDEGSYSLGVNLVNDEGQLVAFGDTWNITVGQPLPPTPVPTPRMITTFATPETIVTAPAPADEARIQRTPIRASVTGTPEVSDDYDAMVAYPRVGLRDGPGFSYEIVSDLRVGDRLRLTGRTNDGQWLRVRVISTGVEGWVHADVLDLRLNPRTLEPVVTATPTSVDATPTSVE
jgi:hypothetical protein